MKIEIIYKKRLIIICLDILFFISCYFLAFMIRFEMNIPPIFFMTMLKTLPVIVFLRLSCFWFFGLYKGVWRFTGTEDLISILKASSTSSILIVLSLYFINQFSGYPRSIFIIDWLLIIVLLGAFRFSLRLFKEIVNSVKGLGKRILIVGAGDAGEAILHEIIKNRKLNFRAVGLIDDDPSKKGLKLHGIEVLGNREDIPRLVKKLGIEEIIISIPSADTAQMREIIEQCIKSGAKFKTIPSLAEIINGKMDLSLIRDVRADDLLRREPLEIELDHVRKEFTKKKILITGAGGSIGKELCKQIAEFNPEKLILLDHAENSMFYIYRDIRVDFPSVNCIPLVADIRDSERINQIFTIYNPHIIFHAAAHKHVPLMEQNAGEAIKNNVLGTKTIADNAIKHSAEKFIFISTDKAVKPKNFMGATKRVCELYIKSLANINSTRFMSVRFGNVIGSTGSVVRLFKEQIKKGGPVTVTHPEASRFLMSIPEAVQLIIQAAFIGQEGEIFVLDMGKPIKIMDLAKTIIRLSGFEPEKEVPIVITGLRPGEKIYEELFDDKIERLKPSIHKKIFVVESLNYVDCDKIVKAINELEVISLKSNENELINKFLKLFQLNLDIANLHE